MAKCEIAVCKYGSALAYKGVSLIEPAVIGMTPKPPGKVGGVGGADGAASSWGLTHNAGGELVVTVVQLIANLESMLKRQHYL